MTTPLPYARPARWLRHAGCLSLLLVTTPVAASGAGVVNGNFTEGNVGFTSSLQYVPAGTLKPGQHSIRTSASSANGAWCQTDHTGDGGGFLVCDGASVLGVTQSIAWRQTVAVCKGTSYVFGAYVDNLQCTANYDDPIVGLRVDGAWVVAPVFLPESTPGWTHLSGPFVAQGDTATLEVVSVSTAYVGNDFGVDDITLVPVAPSANGWWPLADGLAGAVRALALFDPPGPAAPELYAGGIFPTSGGLAVNNLARWNGTSFAPVGAGVAGTVYALTTATGVDGPGTSLYAGGFFTSVDGVAAKGVARYDGTSWHPLGAGVAPAFSVQALASFADSGGSAQALYAGGSFTSAGGVPANNLARWNGTAWSALGAGLNGFVKALVVHDDGGGPALYVGGFFSTAGGAPANNIARWNGTSWSALGAGLNGEVRALAVFDAADGLGPRLVAGGAFTTAGGAPAARVAAWNGASWSALGTGADTIVNALAVSREGPGTAPALFAGGQFHNIGGVSAPRIARWNGSAWSAVGAGINPGTVGNLAAYALREFDPGDGTGPSLVAAGEYTVAGDLAARSIARWGPESTTEVLFDGLVNRALNGSTLTRVADGLRVDAGANSRPEVVLETTGAAGARVTFASATCPGAMLANDELEVHVAGSGPAGPFDASVTATAIGSVSADFSTLASGNTNATVVVREPSGFEHHFVAPYVSAGVSTLFYIYAHCIRTIEWTERADIGAGFSITLAEPANVTYLIAPHYQTIPTATIWFAPAWAAGAGHDLRLDELRVAAFASAPQMVVAREALQVGARHHRGLCESRLDAVHLAGADALDVAADAIGAAHAVEVDLGMAAGAIESLDPLDPFGNAPAGASLAVRGAGALDGVLDADLGGVTFTRSGATYSVDADPGALGSAALRVQVLVGGSLALDLPNVGLGVGATALGSVSTLPTAVGVGGAARDGFVATFPPGAVFSILGFPAVGDELRITSQGAPHNLDFASAITLRAAGLGGLRLLGGEASAQTLTADALQLSLTGGGTQRLHIDRGAAAAGHGYLILGSFSGTKPGLPISLAATLPLNFDAYLLFLAANPNAAIAGSLGTLDGDGEGFASLVLPPGSGGPALAGLAIHHAAVITAPGGQRSTTNAVTLRFLP